MVSRVRLPVLPLPCYYLALALLLPCHCLALLVNARNPREDAVIDRSASLHLRRPLRRTSERMDAVVDRGVPSAFGTLLRAQMSGERSNCPLSVPVFSMRQLTIWVGPQSNDLIKIT